MSSSSSGSGPPPPTTGGSDLDGSTSGSDSSGPSESASTSDSSSTGDESSGSSATGDPEPACGDGLVAIGELCHALGPIIAIDPAPGPMATGDLNGDGAVDLITANALSTEVVVLYGVGDGNFVAPQLLLDAGTTVHDVVLGDFSGDGWLDVVVTDATGSQVISFANDGTGELFFAGQYPAGLTPLRLAVGDIDGDTTPDLVAFSLNTAQVLTGNGLAGFLPEPTFSVPNGPHRAGLFDLDLDGLLDLLTINQGGGNTTCFHNLGTMLDVGVNHDTGSAPLGMAVGDIDSDGVPDVMVTHASGDDVGILLGDGLGALGMETLLRVGDDPRSVELADLNSDGQLDLVTAHTIPGLVVVQRGLGNGMFDVGLSFEVTAASDLRVAELNGDGVADLIIARATDSSVQTLLSAP